MKIEDFALAHAIRSEITYWNHYLEILKKDADSAKTKLKFPKSARPKHQESLDNLPGEFSSNVSDHVTLLINGLESEFDSI